MKSSYPLAVVAGLVLAFGCGKSEVAPQSGPAPEPSKATYTFLSKAIFQRRCTLCHNAVKPRGKVDLSSYEALLASGEAGKPAITAGRPEKSSVYLEVSAQKMPPEIPKLTEDEQQALGEWIAAGALEKTPGFVLVKPKPGEPNPAKPTFEWLSAFALRKCGSCHGLPAKAGGVDFTSYQTLLASVGPSGKALVPGSTRESGIYSETLSGEMPPERHGLTEEQVKLVGQWIAEGAKNN